MRAPQSMAAGITPAPPSTEENLLARVAGPTPPGRTSEELMMNEEVRYQAALAAFLGVLAEHCGACHGRRSGTDSSAERGPLEFTDDLERMVDLGVIVPHNAAASEVVNTMLDGSMPPPDVAPRPSETEIEAVRLFIDWPLNWQNLPPMYAD
jgi:hypothetical protein